MDLRDSVWLSLAIANRGRFSRARRIRTRTTLHHKWPAKPIDGTRCDAYCDVPACRSRCDVPACRSRLDLDARKNDWHTLGRPRELGVISGWIQPLTRFITVEPDGGDAEDFVKNFEPDAIAGPIALPNSRDYVGHQATDWRAWQPSVTTLICITRSSTGARRRKASERNAGHTRSVPLFKPAIRGASPSTPPCSRSPSTRHSGFASPDRKRRAMASHFLQ